MARKYDVFKKMVTYVRFLVCILCILVVTGPLCFFSGVYLIEEARTDNETFITLYNSDVEVWTSKGARKLFGKVNFHAKPAGQYGVEGNGADLTQDLSKDELRQEPAHLTGYQTLKYTTGSRLFGKVRVEGDTEKIRGKFKILGSAKAVVHVDLFRKVRVRMHRSDCQKRKCHAASKRKGGPVCHYKYDEDTCRNACEAEEGVFTPKTKRCHRHEVLSGMCVKVAYDNREKLWYVDKYGGGGGCYPATSLPGDYDVLKSGDVGLYKKIKPTAEGYDLDFSETPLWVRSSYDPYLRLLWRQDEEEGSSMSRNEMENLGVIFLGVGTLLCVPCGAAIVILCVVMQRAEHRRKETLPTDFASTSSEDEEIASLLSQVIRGSHKKGRKSSGSGGPPPYDTSDGLLHEHVDPAVYLYGTEVVAQTTNPQEEAIGRLAVALDNSASTAVTSPKSAPPTPSGRYHNPTGLYSPEISRINRI